MKTPVVLKKIGYEDLNSRQRENYNFQKVSGILADYGYVTMRLSDDWNGADFIAQHVDRKGVLRVQLKGRLAVYKKYQGIDLYICFPHKGRWYLCPHDAILNYLLETTTLGRTRSWSQRGGYSFPSPSRRVIEFVRRFAL
jgi:hypothetical protein